RRFVEKYDSALISSPSFSSGLPIPEYLFSPTIDPLSDKNRDVEAEFVAEVLQRFGIDPKRWSTSATNSASTSRFLSDSGSIVGENRYSGMGRPLLKEGDEISAES